jgi:hypothetical protein
LLIVLFHSMIMSCSNTTELTIAIPFTQSNNTVLSLERVSGSIGKQDNFMKLQGNPPEAVSKHITH